MWPAPHNTSTVRFRDIFRTSQSLSSPTSPSPSFQFLLYRWARYSLTCSCLGIWWNPKFSEVNRGFMSHLNGFKDWYSYQGLIIAIRFLFYTFIRTEVMAEPFTAPVITAHVFTFVFITYLSIASYDTIKVVSHFNRSSWIDG